MVHLFVVCGASQTLEGCNKNYIFALFSSKQKVKICTFFFFTLNHNENSDLIEVWTGKVTDQMVHWF